MKLNKLMLTPMITEEYDRNTQLTSVFDKLLSERIIYLGEEITDEVANTVNSQLLYLNSVSNDPIYIYINSPGGSIYDGLSIYDTMNYIKSPVYTVITGLAASMGYIIAINGEKRFSLPNSRLMLHQPLSGMYYSQASDFEISNNELQYLKKKLIKIVSEKTGNSIKKVTKDMDRDKWQSPDEALKYGAIDEIMYKEK